MNIRLGAATFFNAASFTSLGSADEDPLPCSGDPIEPGGRDQGKTPPTGPGLSAGHPPSWLVDGFDPPMKKP